MSQPNKQSGPPTMIGGMDLAEVEQNLQNSYRSIAGRYRQDDEIEITTDNHKHFSEVLESLTRSFNRPIDVLDVGCGTGRYFHCLRNVKKLVGVDISDAMLEAARHPVLENEITIGQIELKQGNAFGVNFPDQSFDFIYSLGMFGHGCPVTPEILDRFYRLLSPGGVLFFNVVDASTMSWTRRLRRKVKGMLLPVLPSGIRKALADRENKVPFFGLTQAELKGILRQSPFSTFNISSHVCVSPLWKGTHLKCVAHKENSPQKKT